MNFIKDMYESFGVTGIVISVILVVIILIIIFKNAFEYFEEVGCIGFVATLIIITIICLLFFWAKSCEMERERKRKETIDHYNKISREYESQQRMYELYKTIPLGELKLKYSKEELPRILDSIINYKIDSIIQSQ